MNKRFSSVEEMLDDIDPDLAKEYREHNSKWSVRLRKFWTLKKLKWKIWLEELEDRNYIISEIFLIKRRVFRRFSEFRSFFRNYNLIRVVPRTLKRGSYYDKVDLVPHVLFEMLTEFYEKEAKHAYIEWNAHQVEFGGHSRSVLDVWAYLVEWWKYWCLTESYDYAYHKDTRDNVKMVAVPHTDQLSVLEFEYSNKVSHDKLYERYTAKTVARHKELEDNMIALVKTIPFMWT